MTIEDRRLRGDGRRYRALHASEKDSAALYRGLAASAEGERRQVFLELAAVEDRHAAHWAGKLAEMGRPVPPDPRVGIRTRALTWLARQSSVDVVLPYVERAEHADAARYGGHPQAGPGMAVDERAHARVLTRMRDPQLMRDPRMPLPPPPPSRFPQPHRYPQRLRHHEPPTTRIPVQRPAEESNPRMPWQPVPGRHRASTIDKLRAVPQELDEEITKREPWHRSDRSGALRAAVFGVNDGLVSNTSLVMGFAGSGAPGHTILFAGLAGLLAGAFSMAAGEYISMRSQKDGFEREIELEKAEIEHDPEAEAEELALIYRAKGLDAGEANQIARKIMRDKEAALDTMTREELGLDPDELGSPWSAALSSLIAFALGAAVVVLPFFFGAGKAALVVAIMLAGLSLFAVGAVLGMLNGRGGFRSGFRQLVAGGVAAAVVFGVGHLIGVAVT